MITGGIMAEKPVTSNDIEKLRQSGLITKQEVAIIVGDVLLAENVITKERRILNTGNILLESTRRLLRD
jgi:hypothetical protein